MGERTARQDSQADPAAPQGLWARLTARFRSSRGRSKKKGNPNIYPLY